MAISSNKTTIGIMNKAAISLTFDLVRFYTEEEANLSALSLFIYNFIFIIQYLITMSDYQYHCQ